MPTPDGRRSASTMSFVRKTAKSPIVHVVLWMLPLAAVVWWASRQQSPEWPSTTRQLAWVGGALAVYVIATLMRGERWHAILRSSDIDAGRPDSYGLTVVGYAGNNVLPARGGEVLRVFLLSSRTGTERRRVIGTIVAERLLDAIALGGILVIAAYQLLRKFDTPSPALAAAIVGAALFAVLLAAYGWWKHRHHAERLLDAVKPLLIPLRPLLGPRGVVLLLGSVAIWVAEATVYAMVAESVDISLGIRGALGVVAFTNLAALIPGAPGNAGTYDAAVIWSTRQLSTATKSQALGYDLMLRFIVFVPISVIGMGLLFLRYGGLDRLRAARAAAAAGSDSPLVDPPAATKADDAVEVVEATA